MSLLADIRASYRWSIPLLRWARSSDRETPTATFEELQTFRTKAAELGLQSLGTAALLGWEWLQRGEDIFATFKVEHYRPKERSNMVRVIDEKTRTESWIPLFDEAGVALYWARTDHEDDQE
jgi:hypothetical protein